MSDPSCCWPKCRREIAVTFRLPDTKSFALCDHHGDLVQDEDTATLRRSRKKIGMPMPVVCTGKTLAEVFAEEEPVEEDREHLSDLIARLSSDEFDLPEG